MHFWNVTGCWRMLDTTFIHPFTITWITEFQVVLFCGIWNIVHAHILVELSFIDHRSMLLLYSGCHQKSKLLRHSSSEIRWRLFLYKYNSPYIELIGLNIVAYSECLLSVWILTFLIFTFYNLQWKSRYNQGTFWHWTCKQVDIFTSVFITVGL